MSMVYLSINRFHFIDLSIVTHRLWGRGTGEWRSPAVTTDRYGLLVPDTIFMGLFTFWHSTDSYTILYRRIVLLDDDASTKFQFHLVVRCLEIETIQEETKNNTIPDPGLIENKWTFIPLCIQLVSWSNIDEEWATLTLMDENFGWGMPSEYIVIVAGLWFGRQRRQEEL